VEEVTYSRVEIGNKESRVHSESKQREAQERGNHERNCIEWKREGEERDNVEIAGFVFERALRGWGYRKRHPAKGIEYLLLPGLPYVYA
jgi:hypothetical protein